MRIIAHRTLPQHAPENSLRGVRFAGELGADAVEVDVRITREGTPVLNHDATGWRLARWPLPIRWTRTTRFRRLRRRADLTEPFVDLADALAGSRIPLVLDIKERRALMPAIAAIEATGADGTTLWVRDPLSVAEAQFALPRATVGLLGCPTRMSRVTAYLDDASKAGADEVSLHPRVLSHEVVAAARQRGLRVYCWLIQRNDLDRMLGHDIDGIATDWPEDVVAKTR